MVATVKSISGGASAVKYFYFTEKNFECKKGWVSSKGKEILGFDKFTKESFENLLDGKIAHKNELGKTSMDKEFILKGERELIQLGRRTKNGIIHDPGQELILSAPKSFSIMCLVGQDKRLEDAHHKAIESVVQYIEKNMLYTRVQKKGRLELVKADNVGCAYFTHLTARPAKEDTVKSEKAPDPQIHSHLILCNATKCNDGKWRSIVFDKLYDYQLHLGEMYRMELERESRALGYKTILKRDEKSGKWTFEIDGGDSYKELALDVKEFSTRRQDIEELAEKENRHDSKSMAFFAKITREEKVNWSREALQRNWEGRVQSLESLMLFKDKTLKSQHSNIAIEKSNNLEDGINYAISYLSEKEAVWEYESLISGVIEKLSSKYGIEEIESAVNQKIKNGELLTSHNKDHGTLTTKENLITEKRCIKIMQSLQGRDKPLMNKKEINDVLRDKGLNKGQKDAAFLILNSKDRVVGIQGSAGTGKTTTLNTVVKIAKSKEYELIGLAPTRSASATLKSALNIEANTVHKFTAQYDGVIAGRGAEDGKAAMRKEFANKIVVVDEASLISSNKMADLLTLSEKLKFKMILLGDSKQLGGVEAGKPFYYLQNHGMDTALMQDIVRQAEGSNLLRSVYLSEAAIDKERGEVKKKIYEALGNIGKDNVVDIKEIKLKELEEKNKNRIVNNLSKEDSQIVVKSDDIIEHAYNAWRKQYDKGNNSYIVAPSNYLREGLNSKIRGHYVFGESSSHLTLKRKDLALVQLQESSHYKDGDVILFNRGYGEFKKNSYYQVKKASTIKGQLILESYNTKSNSLRGEKKFLPEELKGKRDGFIEVFEEKEMSIGEGEKIKWIRNRNAHDFIINGASAVIKKIKKDAVILDTSVGEKKLKMSDLHLRHIDYDYSHTAYSAQGKTVDYIIGITRANEKYIDLTTQRAFYVSISRARKDVTLIIDDYNGLINSLAEKSGDKTSAIEHIKPKTSIDVGDLFKQGREVYITKNTSHLEDRTSSVNDHTINKNATKSNGKKIDYDRVYKEFLGDKRLIEATAVEYFGNINHKLSKGNQLRFGNKGAVVINMEKATWYDFGIGEGGSLFKLYKERLNKYDLPLIESNQKSEIVAQKENVVNTKESKIRRANKLFNESVPINDVQAGKEKTIWGRKYLESKRKIDLGSIKLSDDVRFTDHAYNSETGKTQSAVIGISRDGLGNVSAAQMIFLNSRTGDKDKSLNINKRTIGALKGSFVELTKNKSSNTIFIAEGIETGLSIASAEPEARVISGLGISNFKNINSFLTQRDVGKKIVICADNDGNQSITTQAVDMAAYSLKDVGLKDVAVIKPDILGYDFNDVLKARGIKGVKYYTASVLVKYPKIKNRIVKNKKEIIESNKSLTKYNNLFESYRNINKAEKTWNKLVRIDGIDKTKKSVEQNPQIIGELKGKNILGINTKERKESIEKIKNNLDKLVKVNVIKDEIKTKEKNIKYELDNYFKEKLTDFKKINTKGLNSEEIKEKLEKIIRRNLNITDNITDYIAIKKVTERVTEKIINFRNIYQKEATSYNKKQYFLESRYELAREDKLREYLSEEIKIKNNEDKILYERELKRLINIDSRLSKNKNEIYCTPENKKILMTEYRKGNEEISSLTKEYIKRGFQNISAHFIATETIKYKEKYGRNMNQDQLNYLCKISSYVEKNYKELINFGFSKNEAIISYNEAEKLFQKYDKNAMNITVNKSEIKALQKESKRDLEIINEQNIASDTISIEIENEGITL